MTVNNNNESKDEKEKFWPQWLAALALSLIVLNSGLVNGWSSPYLAQLTSVDSDSSLKLSDFEASWVASLLNLGRLIGAFTGALIQGFLGRKIVLLFGAIPMAIGWICTIIASSVFWLYISRFFLGIGSGITWGSLSIYLGEIAHPSIRGALISLNINVSSVGVVLGNVMGSYLPMEVFAYISLVPNFLFLALFSLIPETPYHHVQNGHLEKAEESLKWFRRTNEFKKEIQDMLTYSGTLNMTFLQRLREFRLPGIRKSAIIIILLQLFCVFSMYNVFYSYMEIIIRKAQVTIINPSTIVAILGICPIATNFLSAYLVDKFGRRSLLMTSSIGVTISLLLLGLHFHLLSLNLNIDKLWILPIFSLFLFSISFAYGLGCVPSTLVGELFPPNIKSFAGFASTASAAVFNFCTTRAYQPLIYLIGEKYVFLLCAIVVFLSLPFVYYVLPETKCKSLLEIQNTLTKKKNSENIKNPI
ncbi:facilitated trehalose transporter Tret1-like [Leptopilina boulardi]|uniref:facilitated trehalose transporter Tret1-like n=1 Tax=Leptopilina boulardi TaxID=63433 RepID=UPI0021F54B5B|nr:facilitated trehalose transporter Tret1-like [Leptopilina boulardi]